MGRMSFFTGDRLRNKTQQAPSGGRDPTSVCLLLPSLPGREASFLQPAARARAPEVGAAHRSSEHLSHRRKGESKGHRPR